MFRYSTKILKQWDAYSFKVNFRNQIVKVNVCQNETNFKLSGNKELHILVNNQLITLLPNYLVTVSNSMVL